MTHRAISCLDIGAEIPGMISRGTTLRFLVWQVECFLNDKKIHKILNAVMIDFKPTAVHWYESVDVNL